MKFTSRQFGDIDYQETHEFQFPDGIIGFEHLRKFLIIDDEDSQPFRWLVSLEDPNLSFPMIPPSIVVPDYAPVLPTGGTVFAVAVLNEPIEQSTVNLRAPVMIDTVTREGRQVVLEQDRYSLQHPLFAPPAGVGGA
ncbi:MAG: flagellar assembly protein FliW [Ignavibacteria bacterium]|nr:flagellar assembly protein FliW [Ignavibacteria bacterium]